MHFSMSFTSDITYYGQFHTNEFCLSYLLYTFEVKQEKEENIKFFTCIKQLDFRVNS